MIYVYKLPEKLADGHCFSGGNPITFWNIDWMNSIEEMHFPDGVTPTRDDFIADIKSKNYAQDHTGKLLCVDSVGELTMMIDCSE